MLGKYRRYVEFGLLLVLAVALLWWFGRGLDWGLVRIALRQSDWRLIALAWVTILAAFWWRAMRWRSFLSPLCKAGLRELWIATTVGYGVVLLVGRAGEVVRPIVLPMRDRRVRPAASFVTILIERVYDVMAVGLVFAISLSWYRPASGVIGDFSRIRRGGLLMLTLCFVGIIILILFRLKSEAIIGWCALRLQRWPRIPLKITQTILHLLEQLARALGIMANARELAVTIGWTVLLWGSIAFANLLVFRAFHLQVAGRPIGFTEALFVLGFSMVGSAVPTPGGAAGAFHAATAAGLVFLGITKEQAAAVVIVLHLVDFGPAFVFGLYYFLRGEVSLARLRELMKEESVERLNDGEKVNTTKVSGKGKLAAVRVRD